MLEPTKNDTTKDEVEDKKELVPFFLGGESDQDLGGLEDLPEEELEQFRKEQQERVNENIDEYEETQRRLKSLADNNKISVGTVYKASGVSPDELRSRNGWKIMTGTEDFEQHLIGLQSKWISTSSTITGAERFRSANGLPYIYKLEGSFTGVDANKFIDALGKEEHFERKANDEVALTVDCPLATIKEVWSKESGTWSKFG
ncbi:MAG: hypothetical protein AAFR59_03555 [Bacteroidota bacterium]